MLTPGEKDHDRHRHHRGGCESSHAHARYGLPTFWSGKQLLAFAETSGLGWGVNIMLHPRMGVNVGCIRVSPM